MSENEHEQLEKILYSMANEAKPENNFEQTLKVKLRERFHAKYEQPKTPFFKKLWRFKIQLTSALVLVLFSSTTLYAYNNDNVTNGHILYPLKRTTENVEGMFATTPQSKTTYYHKMAKRRMRELAVLKNKGIEDKNTLKETDALLTKASNLAMEIPQEISGTEEVESNSPSTSTIQLSKQNNGGINLTDDTSANTPVIIETKHPQTKREKVLEEISKTRDEFEKKFTKREKQLLEKAGE